MKNKGLIIGGILIVVIGLIIGALISSYNNIVTLSETVDNKLADIDVQLERRMDLIPNLVSTVKGYASHEEEIISELSNARAKLAGAQSTQEKADANSELSSAISRLLVVVENYPELKANQNFIQLSDELAGTENRIAVARKDYNSVTKEYNTKISKIPSNIIAALFNFDKKEYFTASQGANEVPKVSFE